MLRPRDRQIENPPRGNVEGLLIHHGADIEYFQVDALADRYFFDGIEIWTLIDADLTGDYCAHGAEYKGGNGEKTRAKPQAVVFSRFSFIEVMMPDRRRNMTWPAV